MRAGGLLTARGANLSEHLMDAAATTAVEAMEVAMA